MALPSSGQIDIDQIRAEFGGTTPVSINQYYRGGGLVPNISANSGVPTSGQISFSNFYGATAYVPDITPDAFDFTSLIDSGDGSVTANTNLVTITGISEPITLLIDISNGEINHASSSVGSATSTLTIAVNGSTANTMSWSQSGTGQTLDIIRTATVSVSNNDTLQINGTLSGTAVISGGTAGASANVRIYNVTSSNTFLDSFPYSFAITLETLGGP